MNDPDAAMSGTTPTADFRRSVRREFKATCADFNHVRVILRAHGATPERTVEQVDYVYDATTVARTRCVKLRHETPETWKLYVYDPNVDATAVSFDLFEDVGVNTKAILDSLLGPPLAEIAKRREIWRDGNLVFHLDEVQHRGRIVEIEAEPEERAPKGSLETYISLIEPSCIAETAVSNVEFAKDSVRRGRTNRRDR